MTKRFIAVLALASLSWWSVPAAMAMAMHSRPHANHETAQPASEAQDHSCCPEGHSLFAPPIFVTPAPAPMPCQDYPCCTQQGPDNSPQLPGTIRLPRPDSGSFAERTADLKADVRDRTARETFTGPFQLSSIRSTVLRI